MARHSQGILLPCEHAAKTVIPSIRASIARVLVEDFNLSRYSAAKILRTTPAAITNYLEKRRGDKYVDRIMEDPELKQLVKRSAVMLLEINRREDKSAYRDYQRAICLVCSRVNEIALEVGCPATMYGNGHNGG
ncbi:MAG: transcriptional regulator [Desulfurococcales archaeon]|nr:transcriptional regulator [Desulfurococcales archaeon]